MLLGFVMERQWITLITNGRFGLKSFEGLKELSLELAHYSDDFLWRKGVDSEHLDGKAQTDDPSWDDKACSAPEKVPVLEALQNLSLLHLKTLDLRFLQLDATGWSEMGNDSSSNEIYELEKLADDVRLNWKGKGQGMAKGKD